MVPPLEGDYKEMAQEEDEHIWPLGIKLLRESRKYTQQFAYMLEIKLLAQEPSIWSNDLCLWKNNNSI